MTKNELSDINKAMKMLKAIDDNQLILNDIAFEAGVYQSDVSSTWKSLHEILDKYTRIKKN